MNIYIQGASALAHYRSSSATTGVEQCPASVLRLTDATSSLREIENAPLWQLGIKTPAPDHPLEVLVANRSQRTRAKSVRARIWKAPLPPTAFRRARKDIYISSPEFLFLQMANCLDLAELAALGMELCGTYRRHVEVPLLGEDGFEYVTEYHQPR